MFVDEGEMVLFSHTLKIACFLCGLLSPSSQPTCVFNALKQSVYHPLMFPYPSSVLNVMPRITCHHYWPVVKIFILHV